MENYVSNHSLTNELAEGERCLEPLCCKRNCPMDYDVLNHSLSKENRQMENVIKNHCFRWRMTFGIIVYQKTKESGRWRMMFEIIV